jgi:hypothetical protein
VHPQFLISAMVCAHQIVHFHDGAACGSPLEELKFQHSNSSAAISSTIFIICPMSLQGVQKSISGAGVRGNPHRLRGCVPLGPRPLAPDQSQFKCACSSQLVGPLCFQTHPACARTSQLTESQRPLLTTALACCCCSCCCATVSVASSLSPC